MLMGNLLCQRFLKGFSLLSARDFPVAMHLKIADCTTELKISVCLSEVRCLASLLVAAWTLWVEVPVASCKFCVSSFPLHCSLIVIIATLHPFQICSLWAKGKRMICGSILYLSTSCQENKVQHSKACLLQQQIRCCLYSVSTLAMLSSVVFLVSSGCARNLVSIPLCKVIEEYQMYAK